MSALLLTVTPVAANKKHSIVEVCNEFLHGASATQLQDDSGPAGGLVPACKASRDAGKVFSPWKKELMKTCTSMLVKQCTSVLGVEKTKRIQVRARVTHSGCAVSRLTLLTAPRIADHHLAAWQAAPEPPLAERQAHECLVDCLDELLAAHVGPAHRCTRCA